MLNPVVVLGPHLLLSSSAGAPSSSKHFLFLAPRHPTRVVTAQSFLLLPPHVPRSQHWPGPGLNPEAPPLRTPTLLGFTIFNSICTLLISTTGLQTGISDCCLDIPTGLSPRLLKLKT